MIALFIRRVWPTIASVAGDWEGEEDGLLRSIHEGDLKAMLVKEVA